MGEPDYIAWDFGFLENHRVPVQIELCKFRDKKQAMKVYKTYIDLTRT